MTEEDEIEALDRVVELYEDKGVPLSQAEIKKRLKLIKKKYSTGSAGAAGASVAAPAVKKHYHWEPAEGNLVKAKPMPKDFQAAWKKVQEYNREYTLCPDRPGAGTQARFAGEQKVAWQRQKGKDANGKVATYFRLLKLSKGFVLQEGYMLAGSGYPNEDEKLFTGDDDPEDDDPESSKDGDDPEDGDDPPDEPEEGNAKKTDVPDKTGAKRGGRGMRGAAPAVAAAPAAAPAKGPKAKKAKNK